MKRRSPGVQKTERPNSKRKRLKFLNVNPINFTQSLLHSTPDCACHVGKNPRAGKCLKEKRKKIKEIYKESPSNVMFSNLSQVSVGNNAVTAGEHNAVMQTSAEYPPPPQTSFVCASGDRFGSLEWSVWSVFRLYSPALPLRCFI